jgi:tetratricopeptide (TPR) repeat protein
METAGGFGFAKDDETSALARKATALKDAGDWDGAINTLREMKERMWDSPVNFGVDAWCRLALVLQQAGRYEESEREFETLLDEMPRLARKLVYWNDPSVGVGEPGKLMMHKEIIVNYSAIIKERRELSRTREARRVERLAKIDKSENMPAVFRKRTRPARSEIQPQHTVSTVQDKPAAASPMLEQYIHLCNTSIESFDSTNDLATKFYEMKLLEINLKELLKIDPENKAARQVEQMMPEMRRKVEAKLIATQQIREIDQSAPVWLDQYTMLERAWQGGDYDQARQMLQKIAYGMVGGSVSDEQREDFKQLMTSFANEDPLYRDIVDQVMPMVAAQPGMLQSTIYKNFPHYNQEQMRYALYFAHEIGDIPRRKKGRSYELLPPGRVIDGEIVDTSAN